MQFYRSDEFLVSSVGRYVLDGLGNGSTAVIFATRQHLDAIAGHLMSSGVNVGALIEGGRYLPMDAAEMLGRFMRNGSPDQELFHHHIGALVKRLAGEGRRLCLFGEMVALLWADGKSDAALQLEELWNALAEQHDFTLFCAYPLGNFATAAEGRPFLHVCKAHSRVLPAEDYSEANLTNDERLQDIAMLQQKALALESEIVERKHVEELLRRREAELSTFVESASIGLHWADADGIIIWANAAELELLGYTYSEYIGRHLSEFHVDPALIQETLARLVRGEKVRNVESQIRCKDGTIKTVMFDASVLWEQGRFLHTQGFTRDISEQRAAENVNRYMAAIVEWSDDAIFSKSLQGIVTSWNRSAQRIFGYEADEIVGRSITMLIPPERLDEETEILSRLRRGERIDHFETIRRCKDGRLLDISLTISPVKDAHGRIIGASKIARDITDRKHADKALATALEQLSQANEQLERRVEERTSSLREAVAQMEEFSYTVSHDLRAPLRGMQVYSEALLEDYGSSLDPEARHCLGRIAENATRLDKMVSDVLTFSRISRAELKFERVALDKLVRDIIQQYPAMLPPRAVIELASLHDVHGHEPSIIQIISNLLGNSVKFVAPGVKPVVQVWSERNASGVRLWIRDNGIGIKPESQMRLFRMFERLHPEMPYEGTGVGLAIVRKAANRMGGDVGMNSDGVNGTTFWVQLPGVPENV